MADFTTSPADGGYAYYHAEQDTSAPASNTLVKLTNAAGALISLALIAGVGVWGYKLLVRDVTGIPVVRAVQGEMRVRPNENEVGGQLARHQGLAVNAVAAEGTAARPADELHLAPQPVDLAEEDQPITPEIVAAAPQPEIEEEPEDIVAAIQSGSVDELVAKLTEGVEPLDSMAEDVNEVLASVVSEATAAAKPVIDAPGVRASLRPILRPAEPEKLIQTAARPAATSATEEVDPGVLPVGTRLVQLGAFDSADIARGQWDKLQERFGPYMQGKARVVQEAQSGGRTFFRLRAVGFEDLADARRFCSALVAENADCIPVVTR